MPPSTHSSDLLLTVSEAAQRLNIREGHLRRLLFERRIAFTKVGRLVRVRESALRAYVEANTVEASE
jgi:excisionase family DNA binding protein